MLQEGESILAREGRLVLDFNDTKNIFQFYETLKRCSVLRDAADKSFCVKKFE